MDISEKKQKIEPGSMLIDELGSLLVLVFMVVMILVFAGYSKAIQLRLSIDNAAKNYLYQMEYDGYLSPVMAGDMKNYFKDNFGATVSILSQTTTTQVGYGQRVTLSMDVKFENPIFSIFQNKSRALFEIILSEDERNITYHVEMYATAKW